MMNLFDIKGKKAIVTGGSRGLGNGMAEALLEAGCEVVAIGSSDKIFSACEKWKEKGYNAHPLKADLNDIKQTEEVFDKALEILTDLDILVCGAGVISRYEPSEFPYEEWEKTINVNLNSVWVMCQKAGVIMKEKGYGKIINIASMCSYFGGQTVPAYSASKGAVMQLTKALSNDWAKFGINVNAIAPGYMATDMTEGVRTNEKRYKDISDRIPMGRWGTPEDMKGITIFLSSKASDYLCGAIIPVDGGYLSK